MDCRSRVVSVLLSIVVMIANAQSSGDSLPDVATLVAQAVVQEQLAESKEQDYVFREDVNLNRLQKACIWATQCPTPSGVSGGTVVEYQVLAYTRRNFEVFWLDGHRLARVLPPCDHCEEGRNFIQSIPISDRELVAENRQIDNEVALAKALHPQGKNALPPDVPPQLLLSRVLKLCTFRNPRRETVNGRSTVLLDFACDFSAKVVSGDEALLKSFSGMVGIDEVEHNVQRIEGKFLSDVKLDEGNIYIHKNTHVWLTTVRLDTNVWLLSTLRVWGEARYFGITLQGEANVFAGNFRKFRTTSRMVTQIDSSTPAASKPSMESLSPVSAALLEPPRVDDQQVPPLETKAKLYWVDSSTGLMWTAMDNGKDVTWHGAVKYCEGLHLAGYSDWSLPNIDELEGISDRSIPASWPALPEGSRYILYGRAKGGLSLTGNDYWSSSQKKDDRGHPSGYAWQFDFAHGKRDYDQLGYYGNKRALCVRDRK